MDFGLNCKLFVNVKRKLFSVVGGLRFIWKASRARCWAALKCASTDKIAYVYKMKVVSKTYASACGASA